MQNISSILKCILKIHQILWTHELNGRAHFWPCPPKNHQRELLAFMNLHQHGKKLAHFIYSVLESGDQTGHAHFWPCQPKPFLSTFNLCEFILIWKKSDIFIDLVWRYGWWKYPTIWLAQNILAHISQTKIFPNVVVAL